MELITSSDPAVGAGIYKPLKPHQTRFLTIFPARSMDDEICSELMVTSLDNKLVASYEALSYTWGSQILTHDIIVNNCQVKVTENLFEALRHLRNERKPRTLWIDAVCVNQQDLTERSQQVVYMRKIFSTVGQVVIWLGREQYSAVSRTALSPFIARKLYSYQRQAHDACIFERQWWFRTWTVQEFLHAQSTVFVCGSLVLSWRDISHLLGELIGLFPLKYTHIYNFVRSKQTQNYDTLRAVMADFGHTQATDPRDKVFAFLSIAKDGHMLVPDYTASVQKIFTDVVEMYINKYHNLDLICTDHRELSNLGLPSWVPDWSVNRMSIHNWTLCADKEPRYCAGFESKFEMSLSSSPGYVNHMVVESVVYTTLNVRGVDIGLITELTGKVDPALLDANDWISELCSWKPEDIGSGTYLNGESNFRAFCRTLVADAPSNSIPRYSYFTELFGEEDLVLLERLEEDFRGIFSGLAEKSSNLKSRIENFTFQSRFARLSSGHMAMVPKKSEIGDHICIIHGGSVPIALRRQHLPLASNTKLSPEAKITYRMIGPCYVHGVMDGEMFENINETFVII